MHKCPHCKRSFSNRGILGSHVKYLHKATIEEEFWPHVNKTGPGGCWLWTSYRNERGYGLLAFRGRKNIRAHRFSWELVHGRTPSHRFCLHKCDVRHCVNPDHIFLGSYAENAADMTSKGRQARGEMNNRNKLTEAQAIELLSKRPTRRQRGVTRAIAAEYGIAINTLAALWAGRSWKHLRRTEDIPHSDTQESR